MTAEAKWVINCLAETKGRYGLNIVLGTLLGANRARLKELGTVTYKSYGVLRGYGEEELRSLILQMTEEGYVYQTEGQYSVLQIGTGIDRLRDENNRVLVRIFAKRAETDRIEGNGAGMNGMEAIGGGSGYSRPVGGAGGAKKRKTDVLTGAGYELFEILRALRLEIAREEALPPYIVFSDKTLIDMCVKLPHDKTRMLQVSGVGENKLQKYGERFLKAIEVFTEEHPGVVTGIAESDNAFAGQGDTSGRELEGDCEAYRPGRKPGAAGRSGKAQKAEFSLTRQQADAFVFAELYYVSDIKNELNRIRDEACVKAASVAAITSCMRFLTG